MDSTQITYPVTFALRRGLSTNLSEVNEIPHAGEPIIETDTLKIKIGDGEHAYNELEYVGVKELNIINERIEAFFASADISDQAIDTLVEIQKILNDSSLDIQELLTKVNEFEALHKEIVDTHNHDKDIADLDRKAIRDEIKESDTAIASAAATAREEIRKDLLELDATHIADMVIVNSRIDELQTALTAESSRATDVENTLDNRITNATDSFNQQMTSINEQITNLDSKVNALPANELEVVKADLAAHKEEAANTFSDIRADYADQDLYHYELLLGKLNQHIDEANTSFQEATDDRAAIRSEIAETSTAAQTDRALIREQYANADAILSSTCEAENTAIRAEFAAADLNITTSLNEEIARATAAEADALAQAKAYTDEAKTTILGSEKLNETYNTLTKIADWIEGDGVNATELTDAIASEANLRQTEDAAIRSEFAMADAAIGTRIDSLDLDHKAEIQKTNDIVAALGTELRGVDSNINARLDAAIAAHETEDARIDAAYKAADAALEEALKNYFDTELGVIANGEY